MKTSCLFLLLLSIGILTGSYGCKKYHPPKPDNPYGLPDATQRGAETFACLINGKPWIGRDVSGVFNSSELGADAVTMPTASYIYIAVVIKGGNVYLNKNYDLSDTSECAAVMITVNDSCFSGSSEEYGGGGSYTYATGGTLIITRADSIHKIISGIFSCGIPSDYCDTLKITDGRFDIRYY